MTIFLVFCDQLYALFLASKKRRIKKKRKGYVLGGGGRGGSARTVSASGFNKNPFTGNLGSWKKNRCIPSVQNPPFFPVPALSQIRHTGGKKRSKNRERNRVWKRETEWFSLGRRPPRVFYLFIFSSFLFPSRFLFDSLPRGYRLGSTRGAFATTTLLYFRVRLIGSRSPAGNVRIASREKRGGRVGKDGCQP